MKKSILFAILVSSIVTTALKSEDIQDVLQNIKNAEEYVKIKAIEAMIFNQIKNEKSEDKNEKSEIASFGPDRMAKDALLAADFIQNITARAMQDATLSEAIKQSLQKSADEAKKTAETAAKVVGVK